MDLTALHEGRGAGGLRQRGVEHLRPIKDHEQTAIGAEARADRNGDGVLGQSSKDARGYA